MTNAKLFNAHSPDRRLIGPLMVLFAILVLSSGPLQAASKKYALIVGVTSYRPGQPLPRLSYTENDANELAQVLTDGGYNVTLMTQSVGRMDGKEVLAPLSDFIRDQLDALLGNPNLKADDIVIVALAGHGVQYELIEGGEKSAKFYFCPTDAEISKIKTANEITPNNNVLDLAEVYTALNHCKAGGKLLLVDACRNDPSKPSVTRSLASITLPAIPPPPGGTAAFFSCSANQLAYEDNDLQHGVFFHHVIKALKGDADVGNAKRPPDGQVTLAELSENVSSTTYDFVRKKYNGAKQAPELKGEFRLSIPLISMNGRFAESIGIKLVPIPVGEFTMGSSEADLQLLIKLYSDQVKATYRDEQPSHKVQITKLAAMSAHEITVGQFRKFVEDTNYRTESERDGQGGFGWNVTKGEVEGRSLEYSWKNSGVPQTDQHPVVNVTWNDALAFCEWLTTKDGRVFRLPTEAEWEYCARAGTTSFIGNENSPKELVQLGNVADSEAKMKFAKVASFTYEEGSDGFAFTAPVGHFPANRFGLYDMIGNVSEWCGDAYVKEYYGKSSSADPTSQSDISIRVRRGGSWGRSGVTCRPAARDSGSASSRGNATGFRLAQER